MSDIDFKNALIAGTGDLADETSTIPTHAGEIVVRPLSRAEVMALRAERAAGMTLGEWEAHMLSKAMIRPAMTPGEVDRWAANDKAGGVIEDVIKRVTEISGLGEGADKSGVPATRS